MKSGERILIIKLSALGDVIQALGPCEAIRRHHGTAAITVLTTAPYAALFEAAPWCDAVWVDDRPGLGDLPGLLRLARRLRGGRFDRVYDLQTSDRSGLYFRLMRRFGGGPEWSGIARGCSHPHRNPGRDRMHTLDRQAEQLAQAGIKVVSKPDLSWLAGTLPDADLREPFVLLVPGGAAHRPEKRWPGDRYGSMARALKDRGWQPVILGTAHEETEARRIAERCPEALSLIGKTDFGQLATLGRRALAAIGNDTGPMHLLAATGLPSVVLYSAASDPALCGQRGPDVSLVQVKDLRSLEVGTVLETLVAKVRG